MKKIILSLILFFAVLPVFAAKDDILGKWITEPSDDGNQIIVEMYYKGNKLCGKIHRLTIRYDSEGNLKKDTKNPDASLRKRTLEGIDFVYGFDYNSENKKYENGSIYHPGEGKTYACYMQIQKDGSLYVRGHIRGFKFLGKTQIWKRVK